MFNCFMRRYLMSIVTQGVIDAIKKLKLDADTLSDAEKAELETVIGEQVDAKVAAATEELTAKVAGLEGDMKAISDALTDGNLSADQTTEAIGTIVGATPVNSQDTN